MTWGIYIAIYLFLAGSGAGAFLTAVTAEIYSRDGFRPLIRSGFLLAGPFVAVGTGCLFLDLGVGMREPWRLFHLFFGNPRSVMTIGAWIISGFIMLAFAAAFFEINPRIKLLVELQKRMLPYRYQILLLGAVFAFSTAIYTGVLLGVVNGITIWNTTVLPALFFSSALSTGLASAVVFAVIRPTEERRLLSEHFFYLNQIHSLLIVIELIFVFCWLLLAANASVTAAQSVAELLTGKLAPLFWIGVVFFGIVDPLLIYIYEVVLHRPLRSYAMFVSDGSVMVGGFMLRYLTLAAALPVVLW